MDAPELYDDRLLLRAPRTEDVAAITEACRDPEMARWTTVPVPYEEKHAVDWVEEHSPRGWTSGAEAIFVITDRSTERYLGGIGLSLDGNGMAEVGFGVAPWARGRGVCTDALRLVCRWGFASPPAGLGLARIEWQCHVGNNASRRVAEKVGFTMEGTCRARLAQRGQRHDGWIAGLLPGELQSDPAPEARRQQELQSPGNATRARRTDRSAVGTGGPP